MNKQELNRMRKTINDIASRFSWCNNFASEELKMIYRIFDLYNVDWRCTYDDYKWYDGKPVTKIQYYDIYDETGTRLDTIFSVSRYYGDANNDSRCELTCYLS